MCSSPTPGQDIRPLSRESRRRDNGGSETRYPSRQEIGCKQTRKAKGRVAHAARSRSRTPPRDPSRLAAQRQRAARGGPASTGRSCFARCIPDRGQDAARGGALSTRRSPCAKRFPNCRQTTNADTPAPRERRRRARRFPNCRQTANADTPAPREIVIRSARPECHSGERRPGRAPPRYRLRASRSARARSAS